MNAAILQDKEGGRHLSASCLLLLHASLNAGWEQRICTAKTLISDLATKALARSDEINRKALPRVGYSNRFIHGHLKRFGALWHFRGNHFQSTTLLESFGICSHNAHNDPSHILILLALKSQVFLSLCLST